MRPILATIHLDALRHNLQVVQQYAPQSMVMAVVKANAYGHGLLRAAAGLKQAHGFAVLGLDEAVALRNAGYQQTLLLLEGLFKPEELTIAAQNSISLVVHCEQQITMLEQAHGIPPVPVFLKMNTSMNRLGFKPGAYAAAVTRLQACTNVHGITMMTHFATADDEKGIAAPLAIFQQATQDYTFARSLANSAAILRYPPSHYDWVRPGILLYGASPITGTPASRFGLMPAMQFTSEIIAVQDMQAGDSVGYGQRFTAAQPTRVGIVACGYADGYPRHAPSGTMIGVTGKSTKTLGRVSMDMLFVDLTDMPEAGIGSAVELWGSQVPVDTVAEAAGTVGYELLCALAPRVPVRLAE